jgi:hypothetical protein
MSTYVLDVEGNVPLPKNATEAMPPMSVKEELEVRARTIKLLADLQGKFLEPDSVDKEKARELAKQMIDNPAQILTLVITETKPSPIWQVWLLLTIRCLSKSWQITNFTWLIS